MPDKIGQKILWLDRFCWVKGPQMVNLIFYCKYSSPWVGCIKGIACNYLAAACKYWCSRGTLLMQNSSVVFRDMFRGKRVSCTGQMQILVSRGPFCFRSNGYEIPSECSFRPPGPRSSSFWVPRNFSNLMDRQARTGDTVTVKSWEMTGRIQSLPGLGEGDDRKQNTLAPVPLPH